MSWNTMRRLQHLSITAGRLGSRILRPPSRYVHLIPVISACATTGFTTGSVRYETKSTASSVKANGESFGYNEVQMLIKRETGLKNILLFVSYILRINDVAKIECQLQLLNVSGQLRSARVRSRCISLDSSASVGDVCGYSICPGFVNLEPELLLATKPKIWRSGDDSGVEMTSDGVTRFLHLTLSLMWY